MAELLAARGWYVIGFDSRAYLSSVTEAGGPLSANDIPRDYERLISLAECHAVTCPTGGAPPSRPVLIGVSEGAGLSVAAAGDPVLKQRIGGVVAIGLGDNNELAWHVRDAVIYVTKGLPKEPMLHAIPIIGNVAPVPVAILRSTRDEFVPPAESDRLIQAASIPKASWTIAANDHRFSDNLKGLDDHLVAALSWIASFGESS